MPLLTLAQNLEIPVKDFAGGMAAGFFGESSGFEACMATGSDLEKDVGGLLSDLKHHKLGPAAEDLSAIFGDIKHSLDACKDAGHSLTEIADALKDIHSVQDMLFHIKADILQWDAVMLDELEHAAKVCSFKQPDAHECGRLIGKGSRQLIIGDSPKFILGEEKMNVKFLEGMLTALLGKTSDIKVCVGHTGDMAEHAKKVIVDLKARKLEKVFEDIAGLLTASKSAVVDCKEASKALEPFLHIMDGVTKKGDLYRKIKHNALNNDAEVLDQIQDMFSSCTFKKPNAEKCGGDIGTIERLFLIGNVTEVLV